jgi:hypothetical protein
MNRNMANGRNAAANAVPGSFLGNLASNAYTGVKNAATGFANAATGAVNSATKAAGNVFNNAAEAAENVVGNAVKNTNQAFNADAPNNNAPNNNGPNNNGLFGLPATAAKAANNMTTAAANAVANTGNAVGNFLGFNNGAKANNNAAKANNNAAKANNNAAKANNSGFMAAANNVLTGAEEPGFLGSIWLWLLVTLLIVAGIVAFFFNEITDLLPPNMKDVLDRFKRAIGIETEVVPLPAASTASASASMAPAVDMSGTAQKSAPIMGGISGLAGGLSSIIEKQLPLQKKEVFNVKENRYSYDDAEPLCKALGAELATYEQVKDAYDHGADWCNYGWVKGQRAVYPTQDETYEKLQQGPVSQRQACGKPGVNGGYFDNPELRFGVNCYGSKPVQKAHDTTLLPNGEANPFTPDALEFDKRVAEFKADSANIGILPFKEGDWIGSDN